MLWFFWLPCISMATPGAPSGHLSSETQAKAGAQKSGTPKAKSQKPSAADRDLDWPRAERADARDPRTLGPPCNGLHHEATCRVCGLRLLYVLRTGAHGLARKACFLPSNSKTSGLGFAPQSSRLRPSSREPPILVETALDGYPTNPKPDMEYQDLRSQMKIKDQRGSACGKECFALPPGHCLRL